MAGQLPPDVLEDLMLMEAMKSPAIAQGGMPGGFGDIEEEGRWHRSYEMGMVEVNFNAGAGPAAPAAPIPTARVGIAEERPPISRRCR